MNREIDAYYERKNIESAKLIGYSAILFAVCVACCLLYEAAAWAWQCVSEIVQ